MPHGRQKKGGANKTTTKDEQQKARTERKKDEKGDARTRTKNTNVEHDKFQNIKR